MRIPTSCQSTTRSFIRADHHAEAGITPQAVSCKLDLTGRRTRRVCRGPRWARVCANVPQVKEGQCREHGSDCTDCFGRCRDQFTRAGGWRIMSEWGRECS